MAQIIVGSNIPKARLIILRAALKLECLGMKRRGSSVCSIVKQKFGFKGNKEKVLSQLETYINETEEVS